MKDYSILNNVTRWGPYEIVETDAWWFEQDWYYFNTSTNLIKKEIEIVPHLTFYRARNKSKITKVLFFPFIYRDFSIKIISKQYHIN